MPPRLSVQLYSLRQTCAESLDAVLAQVAKIGYAGVEPFNLFGDTPSAFRKKVEDLGMQISSSHFPWSNHCDSVNQVVDVIQAMGLSRAPGGFAPADFADRAAVERSIETTQYWVDALKPHNMTLYLHNHHWEFDPIDGRTAYHYLQDAVPEVEFEIDTYWAANFGSNNPAEEIRRVKDRCPLLHIKDGPLTKDAANVAVGQGSMDIAGLFAAADPNVLEWAVVELDHCTTDMMAAVADSCQFLTDAGFVQPD